MRYLLIAAFLIGLFVSFTAIPPAVTFIAFLALVVTVAWVDDKRNPEA